MTICKILEGILPKESVRGAPPPDTKLLEYHFVFACIWAFGSCMMVDKVCSACSLQACVAPHAPFCRCTPAACTPGRQTALAPCTRPR